MKRKFDSIAYCENSAENSAQYVDMKKPLETVFRDNLRFYRNRANMSQEKLSGLLDKNTNYINTIEGGKSLPPLSMVEQIADILGVEPYSLLVPHESAEAFDREKFARECSEQIAAQSHQILLRLLGSV